MSVNISIAAEPIFRIGSFAITNSFLVSLIVSFILIIFALWFNSQAKKEKKSGFYILMYTFFSGLYRFFEQVAGENTKQFFALVASFFVFILFCNWIGLLPGFGTIGLKEKGELVPILRGPTADINTTLALALVSMVAVQYYGVKNSGLKNYLGKFFNFKNPVEFFVGILEINSEVSKVISFTFRLFGNIFAGEVLLTVIASLVPILAPLPFLGLEVFVGLIQALVFTMVSLVFINMASYHESH